jgi:hypothetical protein
MSSNLGYSTIDFSALPLGALFLYPQPCHQTTVFEHVAELFFFPVAVMGKTIFPKNGQNGPHFSVLRRFLTEKMGDNRDKPMR